MRISALLGLIALVIKKMEAMTPWMDGGGKQEQPQDEGTAYNNLELGSYDPNLDNYDLSNYEEKVIKSDYGVLTPTTEVGTLAPPTTRASTKTMMATMAPRTWTAITTPSISSLLNALTAQGKLKRIDLSGNSISTIEDDAFLLPALQELIIPENKLVSLPRLPGSLVRLDAQLNNLQSPGILPESFRELKKLQFLYLSDNKLDYIPVPLPSSLRSLHLQNNHIQMIPEDIFCNAQDHTYIRRALEDIRLDGNPINLSLFPNAYFCLPRLPIGSYT
uniref:Opticin isoform X3 n=1 Tax=Phascolarctos cinereus TaxID=38626 RepID=A0A6P5LKN4_PHACI|nr:opticin isoform X3 [Phascolarctos cinereus]